MKLAPAPALEPFPPTPKESAPASTPEPPPAATAVAPSATTPPPKVYGKGSNKSLTVACFCMRLQVKRDAVALWNTGIESNASFVASSFLGYFLGLAKDYGHKLDIIPFNELPGVKPLTVDDNISMLPLEELHQYVGTLVLVNETTNWRSFEFKIKTSMISPNTFATTALLSNGSQNPLVNFVSENKLVLLRGTKWSHDNAYRMA
jgi:hypothetical protein